MLLTRIISFVVGAACMLLFFTYDLYEWAREEKVMVVSAKASTAQDGRFKGAFLIYRELKGVGDPRTVLVDQGRTRLRTWATSRWSTSDRPVPM
jgi:hypothetical protein